MITDRIGLHSVLLPLLIIKITISSIVIGLKNSYFPLIHLPSCYRTVCYRTAFYRTVCYRTVQQTNHIQSCSLNQPITFKVVVEINQSQPWFRHVIRLESPCLTRELSSPQGGCSLVRQGDSKRITWRR